MPIRFLMTIIISHILNAYLHKSQGVGAPANAKKNSHLSSMLKVTLKRKKKRRKLTLEQNGLKLSFVCTKKYFAIKQKPSPSKSKNISNAQNRIKNSFSSLNIEIHFRILELQKQKCVMKDLEFKLTKKLGFFERPINRLVSQILRLYYFAFNLKLE